MDDSAQRNKNRKPAPLAKSHLLTAKRFLTADLTDQLAVRKYIYGHRWRALDCLVISPYVLDVRYVKSRGNAGDDSMCVRTWRSKNGCHSFFEEIAS